MLRIDESSKTLVAPQAGGLVTEAAPAREELLTLIGASWEAFAGELGLPAMRLLAVEPLPGIDALAFDAQSGRAVVVMVTGETVEWQIARALHAAAALAGMDASELSAIHEGLGAAVPGDSPTVVLVAGGFDPRALVTAEWLTRRHGLDVSAFVVSMLRFGKERLMNVRPAQSAPADPVAEVQWLLTGAEPVEAPTGPAVPAAASTPPPGA